MYGLGRQGGVSQNPGGTGYAGDDRTDKKQRAMGRQQAVAQEAHRAEARHQLLSNQATFPGVDPTDEVLTILRQTLRNFGVVADMGRRSAAASGLDHKMLMLTLQISRDIMTNHPKKLGELYGRDDSLVLALQDSAKIAQLKVNHSDGSSAQELKVAKQILELFPEVKRASLRTHGAPDILVTDAKENYRQALRPFAFAFCDSLAYHHFSSSSPTINGATSSSLNHNATVLTAAQRKRLFQELSSYQTNLPIEFGSSILVRAMEGKMDHIRVLIFGPEDTPYANGCFLFDLVLNDYPRQAPKCQFLTTGGGRYRFNPNLYASGKVCLSLLGTWAGPSWQPNESTLYQLLISIQSLILGESEPYFNEPGVEASRNTPAGQQQSTQYNRTIREYTCGAAILPFLNDATGKSNNKNMYPEFQEAIDLHFRLKQGVLLRQLEEWNQDRLPVCESSLGRDSSSSRQTSRTPPQFYTAQCLERLKARARTSLIDHGEVEFVMVGPASAGGQGVVPPCSSASKKRPRTMGVQLVGGGQHIQEVISLDDDNDEDQEDAKLPALVNKLGSIVTPLSTPKEKRKSVLDKQDSSGTKESAKSHRLPHDRPPETSSCSQQDIVLLDDED